MKIVLDTNCLLVALPKHSRYYWLWEGFLCKHFTLCYTTEIIEEYSEILSRYYSKSFTEDVINTILNADNVKKITVYYKWQLIESDLDDNKFVDCAICAGAKYIITNDKHFNILKKTEFPKVSVLNILAFKKELKII
jgi:putative PIN family toxin of toxin-antitoxin system